MLEHAAPTVTQPSHLGQYLVWDVLAGLVIIVALIRIVASRDIRYWPRGRWSKLGWIVATIWLSWHANGYLLPLGAGAAIHHTWKPPKTLKPAIPDIPFAEGTPETAIDPQ